VDDLESAAISLQLDDQRFAWDRMSQDQVRLVNDVFDPFCGVLRSVFLDDIAEAVERLRRYTAQALGDFLKANPDIPTQDRS
jgi:hypothetical protein